MASSIVLCCCDSHCLFLTAHHDLAEIVPSITARPQRGREELNDESRSEGLSAQAA